LLSPGKRPFLGRESNASGSGDDDSIESDDRRTRENTRSNRQGGGSRAVVGESDAKSQIRSSLTFDSETLELKLTIPEEGKDDNVGEIDENSVNEEHKNSTGECDYCDDDDNEQAQDDDSLNFDVTTRNEDESDDLFSPSSQTGDYSNALAMFSPNGNKR
jgi:hypothetical protein